VIRAAAALLLALAVAFPAHAQTAERRQRLLDLAYVLGEAHALRQACAAEDQAWRSRMRRLIEVEAPDRALETRLAERFNAGFLARRAEVPTCTPRAAKQEAEVARKGQALAESLAR